MWEFTQKTNDQVEKGGRAFNRDLNKPMSDFEILNGLGYRDDDRKKENKRLTIVNQVILYFNFKPTQYLVTQVRSFNNYYSQDSVGLVNNANVNNIGNNLQINSNLAERRNNVDASSANNNLNLVNLNNSNNRCPIPIPQNSTQSNSQNYYSLKKPHSNEKPKSQCKLKKGKKTTKNIPDQIKEVKFEEEEEFYEEQLSNITININNTSIKLPNNSSLLAAENKSFLDKSLNKNFENFSQKISQRKQDSALDFTNLRQDRIMIIDKQIKYELNNCVYYFSSQTFNDGPHLLLLSYEVANVEFKKGGIYDVSLRSLSKYGKNGSIFICYSCSGIDHNRK